LRARTSDRRHDPEVRGFLLHGAYGRYDGNLGDVAERQQEPGLPCLHDTHQCPGKFGGPLRLDKWRAEE